MQEQTEVAGVDMNELQMRLKIRVEEFRRDKSLEN